MTEHAHPNRVSHAFIDAGEFSADTCRMEGDAPMLNTGKPAEQPQVHYLLSNHWGTLYVLMANNRVQWYPNFRGEPDWDGIEEWLRIVEKSLAENYGVSVPGVADKAIRTLKLQWHAT